MRIIYNQKGPSNFQRSQKSIDFLGKEVAPNEPRFGPVMGYCENGRPEIRKNFGDALVRAIMATGLDHDGITPLMVMWSASNSFLFIIRGNNYTTHATKNCLRETSGDLLFNTPLQMPNHRFRPMACAIAEGLIVFACAVDQDLNANPANRNWSTIAEAFICTQDYGATFEFVRNQNNDPWPTPRANTAGKGRLESWCFGNYFPDDLKDPEMKSCWFAPVDYLHGGEGGYGGGQAYLFRAKRPSVGAPWVVEQVRTIYTDVRTAGVHTHTAAITRINGHFDYILAIGDSEVNRMVRVRINDPDNYMTSSLQVQTNFHGAEDIRAAQPVSFATSPTGEILASSDNEYASVYSIIPLADINAKAQVKHLYGHPYAGQAGGTCLYLRSFAPNKNMGYMATHAAISPSTIRPLGFRAVYSQDGVTWGTVHQQTPIWIYGPDLVHGTVAGQILGFPKPKIRHVRPLCVSPGGQMFWNSGHNFVSFTGGTVVPCTKNANGKWLWPAGTSKAGQVVDPQPPSFGPLYHVTPNASNRTVAEGGQPHTSNAVGWCNFRVWTMPERDRHNFTWKVGTVPAWTYPELQAAIVDNTQWTPVHYSLNLTGTGAVHYIVASSLVGPNLTPFFVCLDNYSRVPFGNYSMPHAVGANSITYGDNEIASENIKCGAAWTVVIDFGTDPFGGWDSAWAFHFDANPWIICTIWSSSRDYIELKYTRGASDTVAGTLSLDVYKNGALAGSIALGTVWFQRGGGIYRLIVTSGIQATMSIDGILTSASSAFTIEPPTQIRFSNAAQTVVRPFCYYGIEVLDSALNQAGREALAGVMTFETVKSKMAITHLEHI